MLLTRLKYWRELRGLSLRELADKSKVPYSAISLLENGKREPQGRTVRNLAGALGVEVVELYDQVQALAITQEPPPNNNKTITRRPPSRASAAKRQPAAVGDCWVIDLEGDAFGPFVLADAERLQEKLGGRHKARVYQAATKFEAWELHRQFLIKVARGHDAW